MRRLWFLLGLTLFALDLAAAQAQSGTPDLRQRCYTAGLMHGDDETDPTILGIPPGACRESYDAGRAYSQRMQKESNDALRKIEGILADSCRDMEATIAAMERGGRHKPESLTELRGMLAANCRQAGR